MHTPKVATLAAIILVLAGPLVAQESSRIFATSNIRVTLRPSDFYGVTSAVIAEKSDDADEAVLEVFYEDLDTMAGTPLMRMKEVATQVDKSYPVMVDIMVPYSAIKSIKVKELRTLRESGGGLSSDDGAQR